MAILPLVDTFFTPYEVWTQRDATQQEQEAHYRATGTFLIHGVNDQLQVTVSNAVQAAHYMAKEGADQAMENHIDDELARSTAYAAWRRAMPSATPKSLSNYQRQYPDCDFDAINNDINTIGATLPPGQHLFHGGYWPDGYQTLTTTKPFSTTFCPQVALRESEHLGKAYDAGRIDLFVLRVATSSTNVFAYKRRGTNLGHEKEVLFAAGSTLTLRNRTLIRADYTAAKVAHGASLVYKTIPIYVLEIDIS